MVYIGSCYVWIRGWKKDFWNDYGNSELLSSVWTSKEGEEEEEEEEEVFRK